MKKIILIRHAKSSWKEVHLSDFDRPLNKRGIRDSKFMSLELSKKVISLPFHPYLEKKEINKILNLLDKFFLLNFNKL